MSDFATKLKFKAKALIDKLEFQKIKDSPTIKYYTDWKEFLKYPPEENKIQQEVDLEIAGLNNAVKEIKVLNSDVIYPKGYLNGIIVQDIFEYLNGASNNNGALLTRINESRITALHFSALQNGVYVKIPKGIKVKNGLRVILGINLDEEKLLSQHVIIDVGEYSLVNIEILNISGISNKAATSKMIEIIARKKSEVNIFTFSSTGDKAPSYFRYDINIHSGSTVNIADLIIGSKMHRNQVNAQLFGNTSELNIHNVSYSYWNKKLDYVFDGICKGIGNKIRFESIAAAKDRGYTSIRAIARVDKDSKDAEIDIYGRIFKLSKESLAVASPELEINTGNVQMARHGVSIANITDDEEFYLATRGLNSDEARNLIISEILSRPKRYIPESFISDLESITNKLL